MTENEIEPRALAELCCQYADNRKAENIVLLDVRGLSTITEFFVIVSGSNEPHLRAIVQEIRDKIKETHGVYPRSTDGGAQSNWVVLDYFDVIVHAMHPETREKYDLEGLWGDAKKIDVSEFLKTHATTPSTQTL